MLPERQFNITNLVLYYVYRYYVFGYLVVCDLLYNSQNQSTKDIIIREDIRIG